MSEQQTKWNHLFENETGKLFELGHSEWKLITVNAWTSRLVAIHLFNEESQQISSIWADTGAVVDGVFEVLSVFAFFTKFQDKDQNTNHWWTQIKGEMTELKYSRTQTYKPTERVFSLPTHLHAMFSKNFLPTHTAAKLFCGGPSGLNGERSAVSFFEPFHF